MLAAGVYGAIDLRRAIADGVITDAWDYFATSPTRLLVPLSVSLVSGAVVWAFVRCSRRTRLRLLLVIWLLANAALTVPVLGVVRQSVSVMREAHRTTSETLEADYWQVLARRYAEAVLSMALVAACSWAGLFWVALRIGRRRDGALVVAEGEGHRAQTRPDVDQ